VTLHWPRRILDGQLRGWSEKCYPFEGCGLLLGEFEGAGRRRVWSFVPLRNLLRDRAGAPAHALDAARETLGRRADAQGRFEFALDPAEFNRVVLAASRDNRDVVAVLHTHPDHPAEPSATDAAQPLLAGWSNVIVKVERGRFVEARSWFRENDADPFQEETIVWE
jgi:proteasome lid subunit RPN8/RPN11